MCFGLDSSVNVTIQNTVFANCLKYSVKAWNSKWFTLTNNLMIGATPDTTYSGQMYDMISCIDMYTDYNPATDMISVHDNICQGSNGPAFLFPLTPCDQIDNMGYYNNTASACMIGHAFNSNGGGCSVAAWIKTFHCDRGMLMNVDATQLQV